MTDYQTLTVRTQGPVGWLIFNRPDRLNAMNAQMEDELGRAWRELEENDDVSVIVNTGTGRGFQVGVDLKEVAAAGSMEAHQHAKKHKKNARERSPVTSRNWDVTKPVVCAVNGVCAGAGFHFVVDADFVIAASTATFTEPHVSFGQVSALEPIGLLTSMPFGAVMRMVLLGRWEQLTAQRAHELGLVTEIVDPPDDLPAVAQALGEKIARNSPRAMALSKEAVWAALNCGRDEAFDHSMELIAGFWEHPDNREGAVAFAEKRPPRWAPR